MAYGDFISKVRYLDNKMSKWMLRHFYMLFFEIFLVFIFLVLFVNTLKVIDVYSIASSGDVVEKLLIAQSVNSILIVLLIILNSFWMLFMFNAILRMGTLLRELNFTLTRRKG